MREATVVIEFEATICPAAGIDCAVKVDRRAPCPEVEARVKSNIESALNGRLAV